MVENIELLPILQMPRLIGSAVCTVFKRRDLVPDSSNITGLLILNFDIKTNPMQRPQLYGGEDEDIVETAKERNIGLLSTVELYKIAIAVKDGAITREQARDLIKQSGRIEFRVSESPTHNPSIVGSNPTTDVD